MAACTSEQEFFWKCHLCFATPSSDAARSRHMINLWKLPNDPTRCDNVQRAATIRRARAGHVPIINGPAAPSHDPVIAMARRPPLTWPAARRARLAYKVHATEANTDGARDMTILQDRWDSYLSNVAGVGNLKFWSLFLAIHSLSTVAIDRSLKAVKRVFVGPEERKKFHISRRSLGDAMKRLPPFWPHVLHTAWIDVSHFDLPSGTKEIAFKFIDPIWGWLVAARRQVPAELHWRPVAQRPSQEVYGGGIQYGQFIFCAHASLPEGAHVLCIGLHWDGTAAHGQSSDPVCVCVGNSNSSKPDTQSCIAYMPHVPDERRPEWKSNTNSTEVKFYIRQQCAAAILRVIEESASRGVKCRLLNQDGEDVVRLLYPRLSSMNFDQPEAQFFFGLQNKCSCSKCRRRKGYSAFRKCVRHRRADIRHLYAIANDVNQTAQERRIAQERLHRWGFNYSRTCCLLDVCDTMLVRIPGKDELFPCVDYRDRLHGLIIFLHRMLFTFFDYAIKTKAHRQVLDRRLFAACKRRFRIDGTAVRSPKTIFAETGMTAQDRVILVFMLSHVIGPGPDDIIPQDIYMPLATAISHAQLMYIAARGQRCYSKVELDVVFKQGYLMFFGSLDSARLMLYRRRLHDWMALSHGNPPKRFKRQSRQAC